MLLKKESKWIIALLMAFVLVSSAYAASPEILSIEITPDDDIGTSGIQVNPNPGTVKTITITADITDDDNDINNVKTATPNGIITLNKISASQYQNTFDMDFFDLPLTYPIEVIAQDDELNTANDFAEFEYTQLTALEIDSNNMDFLNMSPGQSRTINGDNDMATTNAPTIQNMGNEIIDVEISGTDLESASDSIDIENINYTFAAIWKILNYLPQIEDLGLYYGISQTNPVSFSLFIPESQEFGTYTGTTTLTAVQGTGNHAPLLHFIKDIIAYEGDLITITADADDLDDDDLTYSINDSRFSKNNNEFTWQTATGDVGEYDIEITVSDGSVQDSQIIHITITEVPPLVDLKVVLFVKQYPDNPNTASPTSFAIIIKNQGQESAQNFNWLLESGDNETKTRTISQLDPGQKKYLVESINYKNTGTFNAVFTVDNTNTVPEYDETNNIATAQVTVS